MKRICSWLLVFCCMISLCACSGNFAQVDLKEPISIPENGMIESHVLEQIKEENAIATFTGTSGELAYEWTIFGSDISDTRDINLLLDLNQLDDGIAVKFAENQDFGFPALLSIYLNDKWTAQSATVYSDDTPVYSVSITGTKTSILNISIEKIVADCMIQADVLLGENAVENTQIESVETTTESITENEDQQTVTDEYLS